MHTKFDIQKLIHSKQCPSCCFIRKWRHLWTSLLGIQVVRRRGRYIDASRCRHVFGLSRYDLRIILSSLTHFWSIFSVYAFCGRRKYLLICLLILYIGSQATLFSLVGIFLPQYIEIANPASHFRFLLGACVPLVYPQKITAVWYVSQWHHRIYMCFSSFDWFGFQGLSYSVFKAFFSGAYFFKSPMRGLERGIWEYAPLHFM